MSRKQSTKPRNHTVGESRTFDSAQNVIVFPNTLSSDIYIDSDDKTDGSITEAFYTNKNNMVPSQVSRIGLKFIDMFYTMPNSNERNNNYNVMIVGSPVVVNFTLPIENFKTAEELFLTLETAMEFEINFQTGIPIDINFLEFNNTNVWTMTGSVAFKFVSCNGITFGSNLHGIGYTAGFVSSIKIIPKLYYTRYIDIGVSDILDSKTLSHKFGEPKKFNISNHLTRLYIPFVSSISNTVNDLTKKPEKIHVISKQEPNFQRENVNINYYSFLHRDISDITITMTDEFQQPLIFETQTIDTVDPITSINSEIPYIKYNLVLSIIG